MEYLILEIYTQSSTFKNPDFQNFQKSYHLPPPTTIMGMAGAGLGKGPLEVQNYFKNNKIKIGIYGNTLGNTLDLLKFYKKNGSEIKSDIIRREILFFNNFYMVFVSSTEVIKELEKAFKNPIYALTLGNSDSISFIKNFYKGEYDIDKKVETTIENTIVEGDILREVIENSDNGKEFSVYSTSEPISYDIPVDFIYEEEYRYRQINRRKIFSFVGNKMKLNIGKEGIRYKEAFIPILSPWEE